MNAADTHDLIERAAHLARLGWAVEKLAAQGAVEFHIDDIRATAAALEWPDLAHACDKGGELISKTMRDLIEEGRKTTAVRYLAAVADAEPLRQSLNQLFQQECTAIITPAAPGVAPKGTATGNPAFCTLWTYVGLPAITIPLMTGEGGMPLGVQLVGPSGDDARLLRTARALVKELSKN